MSGSFAKRICRGETALAIVLTLLAVHLHRVLFRSEGALWRDETGIVNIALLPSFHEIWDALFHDHCPLFFPALIRGWSVITGGATDAHLQVLGLGIGLALLSMLWLATRVVGKGVPFFSLALVALNPTVLFFGDSIRAYGLAAAFGLLTFCLVWRFLEMPCRRRGLLAAAAAVLTVQTLYPAAFLVLATCTAGMAVGLYRRRWKTAVAVLMIGAAAAASLLPYVGAICRSQSWWMVSRTGDTFPNFLDQLFQAIVADRNVWFFCVWFVLIALALALGFLYVCRGDGEGSGDGKSPVLFAAIALVVGLAGYGIFFGGSRMFPQIWYFIPVMSFSAVCCDLILWRMHAAIRLTAVPVAIASVVLAWPWSSSVAQQRRTNLDLVAAQVSRGAAPGDLVVVCPWHYGITFARYYEGKAPWTSLPAVDDLRFHRYDLIKSLLHTNAAEPVLTRTIETLASGHRVWLVGDFHPPDFSKRDPASEKPVVYVGRQEEVSYDLFWTAQLMYIVGQNATNGVTIAVPLQACNPLENVRSVVVSGFKARP